MVGVMCTTLSRLTTLDELSVSALELTVDADDCDTGSPPPADITVTSASLPTDRITFSGTTVDITQLSRSACTASNPELRVVAQL